MNRELLKSIIYDQRKRFLKKDKGILRENLYEINKWFKKKLNKAYIITGHRRVGKSTLLRQIVERGSFNYADFSDNRFSYFDETDFEKLLEIFNENTKAKYILLDEIQYINSWNRFVNRLIEEKYIVIITGSNSALLTKELSTSLTGRHIDFELYPFSFKEFLKYNKIPNNYFLLENRSKIISAFNKFLINGSFPEVISSGEIILLNNYFEDVVLKDIAQRWQIRQLKTLKEIYLYLINLTGKYFTYSQIKKVFDVDVKTAKEYVEYAKDAYLLFPLEKYEMSYKKTIKTPKKIYVIDNGYLKLFSQHDSFNKGHLLENLIFIELKRRGYSLNYFAKDKECDFIVKNPFNNKIIQAIQVTYELNEQNREREIKGLIEAMDFFNLKEGLLLTYDLEDELKIDNKKIIIKPVWKWLLE